LLVALALAFVGGVLLNAMPCVFPVLSLKVLGFARDAGDRARHAGAGLAYTAGVVLSFIALAAVLLAMRAAGDQLGWGFQLQSPLFVAALAVLFTLIGLNLLGVFEVGRLLPPGLATLRARHPLADRAMTGVLAVLVASPCTAPFMGAAMGAALTLPAPQALAVFAALGLGMAAPYLAASLWPGLARWLPRPGPWMAHFKTALAFPMFATVVWLVWVIGQQAGIDGVAALLGVLLALAFLLWALGIVGLGARARVMLGSAAGGVMLAALVWAWPALPLHADGPARVAAAHDAGWEAWSPAAVAAARAQARPVFVDFTAAWCVTCQFNKRTTLANDAVQADFRARGVVLLRADWTRRDAAITRELTRLGRSGVPVYALYGPGTSEPELLSEVLTVAGMRDAMARWPAAGTRAAAATPPRATD
jgi:thiol:disulfide interchange protein DsbD